MNKKKKIDSVQMMRDIREKLSKKYWKNSDILKQDMKTIQERYHLKITAPKN